jgi:hypothetical protein
MPSNVKEWDFSNFSQSSWRGPISPCVPFNPRHSSLRIGAEGGSRVGPLDFVQNLRRGSGGRAADAVLGYPLGLARGEERFRPRGNACGTRGFAMCGGANMIRCAERNSKHMHAGRNVEGVQEFLCGYYVQIGSSFRWLRNARIWADREMRYGLKEAQQ